MVPSLIRSRIPPSLSAETGTVGDALAFLVQAAEQLIDDPIRSLLGIAPLGHCLEIIRGLLFGDEHVGIVGRKPEGFDEPRPLLIGNLRKLLCEPVHKVLRQLERKKVGIWEIAIVVRLLLRAHRPRLAGLGIEQPRLLLDAPAVFQDLDLPPRLMLDGLPDEADRVHVLDLAARAERGAGLAHRDIDVGTQ